MAAAIIAAMVADEDLRHVNRLAAATQRIGGHSQETDDATPAPMPDEPEKNITVSPVRRTTARSIGRKT
jgi:hypothetical protein